MSEAFKLRQVLVADEASFAENVTALGSVTWSKHIPVLDATFEPMHQREPDEAHRARLANAALTHKGARRGKLRIRSYWMGHISDPTGALTETWQQDLIGDGLGGNATSQVGGVLSGTPTTISLPFTGATLLRGGIVRVGAKADGRADGQAAVVGSAITTPASLLTALPAAPAAADVLRAAMLAYHSEGATLGTKRFAVLHATTGAQYFLFGCQLSGVKVVMPVGGKPTMELEYEVAYYERSALSYPNSLALQSHDCAPITGGSFFLQDVGTTTRALKNVAELELDIALGLDPIKAIGGAAAYQDTVGWARTGCDVHVRARMPWESSFETLFDTENPSYTKKHMLVTLNTGNGRSVGFYAPSCFLEGQRPDYPVQVGNQNYVETYWRCSEGPDETNELTRSAIRLFAA